MIDRKKFFDAVRKSPFGGTLSHAAVNCIDAILDEWERRKLTDLRQLSYMLATVLGECGKNMQPVREGFKKTDEAAREYVKSKGYKYAAVVNGQVFYGRGLVQLTWDRNYRAMGQLLGLDLLNNPDLALRLDIAVKILFEGMIRGSFTGKKLADYFTATNTDWVNARRIINGTDRASEIAGYARAFHSALTSAAGSVADKAKAAATTPEGKGTAAVIATGTTAAVATAQSGRGPATVALVLVAAVIIAAIVFVMVRHGRDS